MSHLEHRKASPSSVVCAVLTVSDSRTEADDESGRLYRELLTASGHTVLARAILKNDSAALKQKILELMQVPEIQVIITSGGTGLSRRDISVETVTPLLEKTMEGFGELFRSLSYQEIGTSGVLSRSVAGVAGGKILICLPGSLGATRLALGKIILPEIGHMVREATR